MPEINKEAKKEVKLEIKRNSVKPEKKFDYIVIGSGLSGILLAKKAQDLGYSVALIESLDVCGGFYHFNSSFSSEAIQVDTSLHFIGKSPQNETLLSEGISHFNLDLSYTVRPSSLVTYESGSLRQFIGFGKTTPDCFHEISSYLASEEIALSQCWSEILKKMSLSLKENLFLHHLASEVVLEGNQVLGVMVNGSRFWESPSVIFTGGIHDLPPLLPSDRLSLRLKNNLKRPKLWTLVAVDFLHPQPVTLDSHLHILTSTSSTDTGLCLGRFHPVTEPSSPQISQWLSFCPDEDSEDTEHIGSLIKKIKRQIKKPYPTAFEGSPLLEKIVVTPSGAGCLEDPSLIQGITLKGVQGLALASSHLTPQKGALKALDQALKVSHFLWQS
jgi:hypothetical protein